MDAFFYKTFDKHNLDFGNVYLLFFLYHLVFIFGHRSLIRFYYVVSMYDFGQAVRVRKKT